MALALSGTWPVEKYAVGSCEGVEGWDEERMRERRQFVSDSVGEEGESVGEENEVEEDEDVRFELSSAPEDVTSCELFCAAMVLGVIVGASNDISELERSWLTVLMLRDFL